MAKTYLFRRLDNDKVVEVGFEKMIEQDAMGCITLPDGHVARRCIHLERERDREENAPKPVASTVDKPIVSAALGFIEEQLPDFIADREKHGFTGVEFVQDKDVPQFYNVQFVGSRKEWQRYIQHRGCVDNNSKLGGSATLTQADLDAASRRVLERYPTTA